MGAGTHLGEQVLASRAREAPARCGAYILLGADRELLYVGKAANLRRRLLDHARGSTGVRVQRSAPLVREVRWVECANEREAFCLEADLIVALAPTFNAVMVDEAFTYVCVEVLAKDRIRVCLTEDGSTEGARTYGAFPHLGKGKHAWRAVRTNAGFSALLRLLWVAFGPDGARFRPTAKLRGSSPPVELDARFDPLQLPMLHDFLSGRSGRLTTLLRASATADDVPGFMRRPLVEDLEAAEEFYRLGPRALHRLRRRHDVRPGPVDRDAFTRMVYDDLREAIGAFVLPTSSIRSMRGRMSRSLRGASALSTSPARRVTDGPRNQR